MTNPSRTRHGIDSAWNGEIGFQPIAEADALVSVYQSNETYTYDANGNRTMAGYQTGTDNRLTNDGTYSYTYDAEGNRLTRTKTATGEVTEYTWDYHNRLTTVTEKNSRGTVTQVVEYIYDVFNRRIGRKIDTSAPFDMANAVIERYVLDGVVRIEENFACPVLGRFVPVVIVSGRR